MNTPRIEHPPYQPSLSELKNKLIYEIDMKTQEIIFAGFTHSGKKFSMSQNAQINWLGLSKLAPSLLYPYKISTKFDEDYLLQSETETNTFIQTAMNHKEQAINAGRDQKNAVNAMSTIEQLKAYSDHR